jgi:hypothetical protein
MWDALDIQIRCAVLEFFFARNANLEGDNILCWEFEITPPIIWGVGGFIGTFRF